MLIAHVGWIFFIQVLISIIIVLWGYQRYAKRWSTSLGRDSVEGVYTRVDFIEGESAYYAISYRYTVSGKRYFGSISRSHLSFGLFSDTDENIEELKKEYLSGKSVSVFYYKESPVEHWLNIPPSHLLVFFKSVDFPLLILILSNVPLLFIDFLITYSP